MYLYNEQAVKTIRNNIAKSLEIEGVTGRVEIKNYGKCIEAYESNGLFIWIRLLPQHDKYVADISSITLPEHYRRRGVFTNLFNRLNNCKYVSEVRITGVCTEEMQRWCIKNKLNKYGYDYTSRR